MDVWIGGLAEQHLPGALVGPLLQRVMSDQFQRLRDGDRFWYQTSFNREQIKRLEATTLADVIRRNTRIGQEISDDVFRVGS